MSTTEENASESYRGLIVLCSFVLLVLLAFAVGVNGLGPLDDHRMLGMLLRNEDFGFYIMPDLGRFFPLSAQEYVALTTLFGGSPKLFYLFNALKLIPVGVLLYLCLTATPARSLTVFVLWCTALLSVGTANTLFRLSAGELNSLILMLIVAWSALLILEKGVVSRERGRWICVLGLSCFFLALFYKELTFVFGAALGGSEWIRYRRTKKERPPLFVYSVLLLSTLYVAGYYLWRLAHRTGNATYSDFHSSSVTEVLALFASSDPLLLYVVMPITAFRLLVVMVRPAKHTFYDSLLVSACAYVCAYLALSIFNWYYLLPAYALAVTGLAGFLVNLRSGVRSAALVAITVLGLNVLPVAASDFQAQKQIINNHFRFVTFLAGWLEAHPLEASGRRSLVLPGVSPGSGVEILVSLKTFLTGFGVREESIEVVGSEPPDNLAIRRTQLIKAQDHHATAAGDVLVFNPFQKRSVLPPLQRPSYHEIYRSTDEWTLPRWTVWDWIEVCALGRGDCVERMEKSRRYAGYAAFVVKRAAETIPPVELTAPLHRSTALELADRMKRSTTQAVMIWTQNTGFETWPATGRLQPGKYVHVAYRWFNSDGKVILVGDRTPLPEPVRPGDEVKLSMKIKTPAMQGVYRLAISPIQEDVQWFEKDTLVKQIDVY